MDLSPTVDQLSLHVDRALSILDENILLESTCHMTPMLAPPTQIHAAELHHRAVSPEIHLHWDWNLLQAHIFPATVCQ